MCHNVVKATAKVEVALDSFNYLVNGLKGSQVLKWAMVTHYAKGKVEMGFGKNGSYPLFWDIISYPDQHILNGYISISDIQWPKWIFYEAKLS